MIKRDKWKLGILCSVFNPDITTFLERKLSSVDFSFF